MVESYICRFGKREGIIVPDSKPTIVPLKPSRQVEAVELLADAFFDDPFSQYMIPDESKRRRGVTRMMGRCLNYGILYGHVETTFSASRMEGLAVWIKPQYVNFNFARTLRSGMIFLPLLLGRGASRRFSHALESASRLHAEHAPGRHWHLFILAIRPDFQRRGVGTTLMQHGLARIDAAGLPCYLETTAEKNLDYYPRHGFEMVGREGLDGDGVNFWAFLRRPQEVPRSDVAS